MEEIDIGDLKGWKGRTTEVEDTVTERLEKSLRAVFEPHLAPVEAGEAPPTFDAYSKSDNRYLLDSPFSTPVQQVIDPHSVLLALK